MYYEISIPILGYVSEPRVLYEPATTGLIHSSNVAIAIAMTFIYYRTYHTTP